MNPTTAAIYQLSKGGFSVYFSPTANDTDFVIEDVRGVLSKVLLRKASITDSSPILTLSLKYQSSEYLRSFGYILVVEPDEPKVWLIPVDEFPYNVKSVRLGDKYERYIVTTQQGVEGLPRQRVRESIQSKLGSTGSIKQEDLDDILSLNL